MLYIWCTNPALDLGYHTKTFGKFCLSLNCFFICRTLSSPFCNKKHLKNVGPIRHSEPPHAALPFTRCRYCRVARRLRIDVHDDDYDDDDNDNA